MHSKPKGHTFLLTLFLFFAGNASAHDIWLLPEQFNLAKGDTLRVRQMAGSELDNALELKLIRQITPRFELITESASFNLLGEPAAPQADGGPQLVLQRTLDFEGLALLTMEHDFIEDDFSTDKFLEHLKHEGYTVEQFQDQLGGRAIQSERYKRTLKSLVKVGNVSESRLHQRVLGQTIEIVLLQNPYLLDPGNELAVQVLFNGAPLPNQLVMAFNRGENRPVAKFESSTDAKGVARFTLDKSGIWLIRLVHIRPCRPDRGDCSDVDWESFWSSISFELD